LLTASRFVWLGDDSDDVVFFIEPFEDGYSNRMGGEEEYGVFQVEGN